VYSYFKNEIDMYLKFGKSEIEGFNTITKKKPLYSDSRIDKTKILFFVDNNNSAQLHNRVIIKRLFYGNYAAILRLETSDNPSDVTCASS